MNKKDGEFMKFDGKYDKVIQEIAEEEGITVQTIPHLWKCLGIKNQQLKSL